MHHSCFVCWSKHTTSIENSSSSHVISTADHCIQAGLTNPLLCFFLYGLIQSILVLMNGEFVPYQKSWCVAMVQIRLLLFFSLSAGVATFISISYTQESSLCCCTFLITSRIRWSAMYSLLLTAQRCSFLSSSLDSSSCEEHRPQTKKSFLEISVWWKQKWKHDEKWTKHKGRSSLNRDMHFNNSWLGPDMQGNYKR